MGSVVMMMAVLPSAPAIDFSTKSKLKFSLYGSGNVAAFMLHSKDGGKLASSDSSDYYSKLSSPSWLKSLPIHWSSLLPDVQAGSMKDFTAPALFK